jgi:PST family polysaccharide transporter
LARLLLPEDNGLVGMVTIITGFISLFNDLGLSAATIQQPEITHKQVSTLFWINVALGGALALLTAALTPAIAWFYNEPRLFWISLVIATDFIYSGLTIQHRALLNRQMRFTSIAVINIVAAVVSLIAGVIAALAGLGYWSLVIKIIASAPVDIIGTWTVCRWRPGWPVRRSGVRAMVAFGSNLTGFRFINYIARNFDNLLIGRFFGPYQLGLYVRAYGLLLMPLQQINNPISSVAIPALSRLADSPERYRQAYAGIASQVCLLSMPLIAYMLGTADWIILATLGPKWTEASVMFALLAFSGLLEPISNTTGWLFISQARTRHQFQWGIIGTALTVAAIIAGLPWGAVGVSAAYGIMGLFIRTPLLFWSVGRGGHIRAVDLYRIVAPFACASTAIVGAIFLVRRILPDLNPFVGLAVTALVAALASLSTLTLIPAGRATLFEFINVAKLMLQK